MRRPPNKDGQPTDVESSNATLNTLFGGSRQKSWMINSSSNPVRPTPRASISRPSTSGSSAERSTSVLPSSIPSPSQILPRGSPVNRHHSENNTQTSSNENVRPVAMVGQRSASSANQIVTNATTQSMRWNAQHQKSPLNVQNSGPIPTLLASPVPLSTSPGLTSPGVPLVESSENVRASQQPATALRSPSPEIPHSDDSVSGHLPREAAVLSGTGSLPSNVLANERQGPQRPSLSPIQALESHPLPSTQLQKDGNSNHPTPSLNSKSLPLPSMLLPNNRNATPPNRSLNASNLPLPSMLLPEDLNSFPQSQSLAPLNPYERRRTQVAFPQLKSRVSLIKAHINSVGGEQCLNSTLERPRFSLLADACNSDDYFYIVVHQVFCLWDLKRADVMEVFSISEATLSHAFKVLGALIRDNDGLAIIHLTWFAQFPSPLADLLRTSDAYRSTLDDVGSFLSNLGTTWGTLALECNNRRYPPLIDEQVGRLGLLSPILQGIMFTATRRNLGYVDDQFGTEMEIVFNQDKQGHWALASRYNSPRPPTDKEIKDRNNALIRKYLAIGAQMSQSNLLSSRGSLARPPIVPSNVNGQPQMPIDPTRLYQGSPYSSPRLAEANQPGSARGPNLSSNGPFQHQQTIRSTSRPSPKPFSHATSTRSPGSMGNRAYSGSTLSPTFMLGLSVNSTQPTLRSNIARTEHNSNDPGQLSTNQTEPNMHLPHPLLAAQRPQEIAPQSPQLQQVIPSALQSYQQAMSQHGSIAPHPQYVQQQVTAQQMQYRQHEGRRLHQQVSLPQQQQVLSTRIAHRQDRDYIVNSPQHHVSSRNSSAPSFRTNSPGILNPARVALPSSLLQPGQLSFQQQQQIKAYSMTPPLERPLVPPAGYQPPNLPTDPDTAALHQTHVRSPRLVSVDLKTELSEEDSSLRFYQSVKGFLLEPKEVANSTALHNFQFSISEAVYLLIAQDKIHSPDSLPLRVFQRGTLQFRLRSIQSKKGASKCLLQDWVVSDTSWPETVFLELNSRQLEIRRKTHHGKDLPIDVTRYVRLTTASDVNNLSIAVYSSRKATEERSYLVALEVVEVLQHPQIMEMCVQHQRIPASQTLNAIKKSLAPIANDDDDDDFAMVVSDLSVDLADPFTSRIFDIPVRGSNCLHRECFDLETFLLTRNSKPKRPGQPCMIDVWKCPLCGRDARPYSLQVDDFLSSVRAELEKQNRLDTKAILISADGTWKPKEEPKAVKRKATTNFSDDDSTDDDGILAKQAIVEKAAAKKAKQELEVINLDGD